MRNRMEIIQLVTLAVNDDTLSDSHIEYLIGLLKLLNSDRASSASVLYGLDILYYYNLIGMKKKLRLSSGLHRGRGSSRNRLSNFPF